MRVLRAFVCTCALLLLCAPRVAVRAQDKPRDSAADPSDATPARPKLALEIAFAAADPPAYWQVGGGGWSGRFERLKDWTPPQGALPVRAVEVDSRAEGDFVRVNVSVHVGAKFLDRQLEVATYLAREGERISVWELNKFGVAPISIRVVNVRNAKTPVPEVSSLAASVVAVGVRLVKGTFPKYEVSLRNDSGRDVAALFVAAYTTERHRITHLAQLERDQPLIRAGDVYELSAWGGDEGRTAGDTYTPGGLGEVVVEAALFSDGSYEGDAKRAAHVRALWAGRRQQIARLAVMLREAAGSPDAGTRAGIVALRERVAALGETTDQDSFAALLAQFPAFDAGGQLELRRAAEFELHTRKNELLVMLEKIEGMKASGDTLPGVRDWLLRTAGVYDDWLARLP